MESERKILATKKMSPKQLEEAIKKKMAEGARNRVSAVNKLYREISVEDVRTEDVSAYFLQDYERKRGGLSVYLQNARRETIRASVSPDTPPPEKMLNIGMAILITNCTLKRNIFTGMEWMETTSESRVKPGDMETPFFKSASTQLPDEGGIVLIKGRVVGVWEVSDYDPEGRRGETRPVLGKGGAVNLKITVVPDDIPEAKRMSVKVVDEKRLKMLIGDDIGWLAEEGAVMELADMLRNTPVLVFGGVRDTIGRGKAEERKVNPYFDLRNFGWIVPSPETDAGDEPVGDEGGSEDGGAGGWGDSTKPPTEDGEASEEGEEEGKEEKADEDDIFLGKEEPKGE